MEVVSGRERMKSSSNCRRYFGSSAKMGVVNLKAYEIRTTSVKQNMRLIDMSI